MTSSHPLALVAIQILGGAAVYSTVLLLLVPSYVREVGGTLRDTFAKPAPGA